MLGSTSLTARPVYIDFIYLINLGLMIGILMMAFSAWKRLILYQKSKWLLRLWNFFEWGLIISLLYNSFDFSFLQRIYVTILTLFVLVRLVLSGNMKWVA